MTTESIELRIATYSALSAFRWSAVIAPFEAETASSFMRCSASKMLLRPASASCTTEVACWMLPTAAWLPRISLVKLSAAKRPDGSSAARLIRRPDDNRSVVRLSELLVTFSSRVELSEETFVLMLTM